MQTKKNMNIDNKDNNQSEKITKSNKIIDESFHKAIIKNIERGNEINSEIRKSNEAKTSLISRISDYYSIKVVDEIINEDPYLRKDCFIYNDKKKNRMIKHRLAKKVINNIHTHHKKSEENMKNGKSESKDLLSNHNEENIINKDNNKGIIIEDGKRNDISNSHCELLNINEEKLIKSLDNLNLTNKKIFKFNKIRKIDNEFKYNQEKDRISLGKYSIRSNLSYIHNPDKKHVDIYRNNEYARNIDNIIKKEDKKLLKNKSNASTTSILVNISHMNNLYKTINDESEFFTKYINKDNKEKDKNENEDKPKTTNKLTKSSHIQYKMNNYDKHYSYKIKYREKSNENIRKKLINKLESIGNIGIDDKKKYYNISKSVNMNEEYVDEYMEKQEFLRMTKNLKEEAKKSLYAYNKYINDDKQRIDYVDRSNIVKYIKKYNESFDIFHRLDMNDIDLNDAVKESKYQLMIHNNIIKKRKELYSSRLK